MDIGKKLRLAIAGATLALLAACGGGGGGAPVTHPLTVATAGSGTGSVTSGPAGINCGASCTASFDDGTTVTLTAAAANGSVFSGWSGACTGSAAQASVTVDAARTCTADFAAMRALGVSLTGAGSGTVTGNPAGIACGSTCSASHVDGTSVTLTAAPAAGSAFVQWGGDCAGAAASATVILTAPRACTAQFAPVHALTVTRSGSGSGTVTGNVGSINCGATCSADYVAGTNVTLTAAAASGSLFAGWGGACSGVATTASVTVTAASTCTATFNAVASPVNHTLIVTRSGAGTGTVTSVPAGINCGSTCSASFSSGASVTLTSTPANGSVFAGWTGDCTGTAAASTIAMSAARSCAATFTASTVGALSDVGYHLLADAGAPIVPTTTVTFANGTFSTSIFSLHAVNITTGAATVVAPAGQWYPYGAHVMEMPADAATAVIPTARQRITTFANGGRLYKIDHIATVGTPTPQLWTTANTSDICTHLPVAIGAGTVNARHHFYIAAGADRQCSTADDLMMALPFSAGAADSPIQIAGRVLEGIFAADFSVTGYLGWNAGQVFRLDANLANPVNLFALPQAPTPISLMPSSTGALETWVFVDRGLIRAYNLGTGALSSVTTPAVGVFSGAFYAAESGTFWAPAVANGVTNVVRVDLASLTGQIVGSFPSMSVYVHATSTRIVGQVGNQIYSFLKSGSTSTVIASAAAPAQLSSFQFSDETIWFESRNGTTRRMGIVGSDGSNLQYIDNATFQSGLMPLPTPLRWGGSWGAITLIEGLGANGSVAGASLRTYDGSTRAPTTHGTFPTLPGTGMGYVSASPVQFSRYGLASFYAAGNVIVNLYLYKSDSVGLTQVTNY